MSGYIEPRRIVPCATFGVLSKNLCVYGFNPNLLIMVLQKYLWRVLPRTLCIVGWATCMVLHKTP